MRRRRHTRSRPRPSAIVNSWLAVVIVLTLYPPRTKRSYLPRITRPRAAVTVGRPGLLVVVADVSGIARRSRGPHNRISTWLTPVNGSRRRRDGRHGRRTRGVPTGESFCLRGPQAYDGCHAVRVRPLSRARPRHDVGRHPARGAGGSRRISSTPLRAVDRGW